MRNYEECCKTYFTYSQALLYPEKDERNHIFLDTFEIISHIPIQDKDITASEEGTLRASGQRRKGNS